jgi:hypothetical protein
VDAAEAVVKVVVERDVIDLATVPVIGHGGEADVYDLGARVLKLYKGPKHPDIAGDAAREHVAEARLADAEARLSSFPRGLPGRVAVPRALVRDAKRRAVVGYVMDRCTGRPLYELGEPRVRRAGVVDLAGVVAAMRDLHATLAALHGAGVVVGDFNDGNVLVDDAVGRAWMIDADSFAWGAWPCPMFTERFVDPRLCDATASAPVLVRAHDRDSDWFAFDVMLFRTLCWVGPYGGVHQPADPARRVAPAARSLRGPSVFDGEVVYPRAAAPLAGLTDELLDHFSSVFDRGARGPFPAALLDRLRLTRCATCSVDHVRTRCPSCAKQVAVPATWGDLTVTPIDPRSVVWGARDVSADAGAGGIGSMWMTGAALWHRGPFGAEQVGQIVPGATRAWVGERFGAGLWRAGGYAVGLTFVPGRRGVDDRARLPAIRGRMTAQGCVVGDQCAWLWWRETDGARELARVVLVGGGRVIAEATADAGDAAELDWLAGIAGACGVDKMLLVPTDDGIVRVEPDAGGQGRLVVTRRFPDTRAFVAAVDDLAVDKAGICVRKNGAPLLIAGAPVRAARLTFRRTT